MSVDQTSHDQVSLTKCPITRYSPFLLYNSVGARVSEKIFVVDREKRVCVESDLPKLDSGTFESPPLLCQCPCNRSPSPYTRLCSFVSLSLSQFKSFFPSLFTCLCSFFSLKSNLSFSTTQSKSFSFSVQIFLSLILSSGLSSLLSTHVSVRSSHYF